MESKLELSDSSLADVYGELDNWLEHYDKRFIDLVLAQYITHRSNNNPLWICYVGNSGCGKSVILKSMKKLPNVEYVSQLTANTLASGKEGNATDLGYKLQNNDTILLIPDLASIKSSHKDSKKAIFGQFRELYDGDLGKKTGNNVNKTYENCHTTLMMASTEDIQFELAMLNELGTRELFYKIDDIPIEDMDDVFDKLEDQMGYRDVMDNKIHDCLKSFLEHKQFNPYIELPENVRQYLRKKCNELSVMRATARFDSSSNELVANPSTEYPTRVYKQMIVLYQGLKSIDPNYDDDKFFDIVDNIFLTSSNKYRYKIYYYLKDNPHNQFSIKEVSDKLKIGSRTTRRNIYVLWNLGIVDRLTVSGGHEYMIK